MSQFIDRRLNGKNKSSTNRQRFIKRYKNQIRKAVDKAISERKISDIDKAGESINIPTRDLSEPVFSHDKGGIQDSVHPGNKEFVEGDRIKKPESEEKIGPGEGASEEGEGEDDFVFQLSRKEFLDLFFEDLELPDLVKKELAQIDEFKTVRAGHTAQGVPSNIDVVRSLKNALSRRMALSSRPRKELKALEKELALKKPEEKESIKELEEKIEALKKRIQALPFIDEFDIRYRNRVKVPSPSTQAVMFCLMDVSGSMDETKKEIAKRFFILLYLFLEKNYEKIELVFIRHHTAAKEVNEQDFFYSRETGGTVVSSALEMTADIIKNRFPTSAWNIYVAQASDGDNWNTDSPRCKKIIEEKILPFIQYYAYVEILPRHHQSLWSAYQQISEAHPSFAMQSIDGVNKIYPVFRELFKRKSA